MKLDLNKDKIFILSTCKEFVIAINECKMNDDDDIALIVGNKYKINDIDFKKQEITIKSELFQYHKFEFYTIIDLEVTWWWINNQISYQGSFDKLIEQVKKWEYIPPWKFS